MIRPMRQTLVILAVGLTPNLVGEHTPNLARLAAHGALRPPRTLPPAVTCKVTSTPPPAPCPPAVSSSPNSRSLCCPVRVQARAKPPAMSCTSVLLPPADTGGAW